MSLDLSDSQLKELWHQGKIPVIFKRNKPLPVFAHIPFAEGNMEWLRDGRRLRPDWCAQFVERADVGASPCLRDAVVHLNV